MDTVHTVIYLLFNEGFHSVDGEAPMNLELCKEAIHLATLLVGEPRVVNQDTLGLLALMNLQLARAGARLDADGRNVPIDLQDRSRWDAGPIGLARGLVVAAQGAPAGASGRFLIEARIAEQHCVAPTFADTNWPAIVALYDQLVEVTGSPIAELHRAVAVGYAGKIADAIARVNTLRAHEVLRASHLPDAVLAHLWALAGDATAARQHVEASCQRGGTPDEQRITRDQVARLLAGARRRP
jgi:RNA polymerase sigma-70 factor (ECF subfamily)